MKILCISDTVDPLIYSPSILKRFSNIDMVISAGDLRLNYYDYIVTNLNKPLLFIFGNHRLAGIEYYKNKLQFKDSFPLYKDKMKYFVGGSYIDKKVLIKKNVIIAGLGGSRWYNGGENQFTEFGMFLKILFIIPQLIWNRIFHGRFLDILVTHSPPWGIHDKKDQCHTGFKIFIPFINIFKPRFLLHGHIHLYNKNSNRKAKIKDTTVLNVYGHYILDI